MIKKLGYVFGALVVVGAFKGGADVNLDEGGSAVLQIAVSVLRGIADMTVLLIPKVLALAKEGLDGLFGANSVL
jgi:hypothetical protein